MMDYKKFCSQLRKMYEFYQWSFCKEAADIIEMLSALAQNGQSAIDTNQRLNSVLEELQVENDGLKKQLDAAINDMSLMATLASECEVCSHRVGKSGCPDRYTVGCNFYWRGCNSK